MKRCSICDLPVEVLDVIAQRLVLDDALGADVERQTEEAWVLALLGEHPTRSADGALLPLRLDGTGGRAYKRADRLLQDAAFWRRHFYSRPDHEQNTRIYCKSGGLTRLPGGCDFSRITIMDLSYNELTTVDLSGLTAMRELDMSHNKLQTLDLSGLGADLRWLDLSHNELTTIDLSGLEELEEDLRLDHNLLRTVHVSKPLRVSHVYISHNLLQTLDLSNFLLLYELDIDHNRLQTLDVSGLSDLSWLDVLGNGQFTHRDVLGLMHSTEIAHYP